MRHCPTTIQEKAKFWLQFEELIRRQWQHGGEKYAFSDDMEWTDVIREFDEHWVLGTILKYVGRYKILGRERDLLKIANYCFILWLQDGHHQRYSHDEDVDRKKYDVEEAFSHLGGPAGGMVPP